MAVHATRVRRTGHLLTLRGVARPPSGLSGRQRFPRRGGSNGAGKTTTIGILLGLLRPTGGTVELFGRLLRSGSPGVRRVGSLVGQPALLPHGHIPAKLHLLDRTQAAVLAWERGLMHREDERV